MRLLSLFFTLMLVANAAGAQTNNQSFTGADPAQPGDDTYSVKEIMSNAEDFFGGTTHGLAQAIQRVFNDYGEPNAYIIGEEGSAAIGVGLRYGEGKLYRKRLSPLKLYWQGPSVGWDVGGNLSKVFVLVYNLQSDHQIFQRFPGIDGSVYVVAGVGLNYQQSDDVILAPIRTGVGLRAGANVGYVHYTRKKSLIPF